MADIEVRAKFLSYSRYSSVHAHFDLRSSLITRLISDFSCVTNAIGQLIWMILFASELPFKVALTQLCVSVSDSLSLLIGILIFHELIRTCLRSRLEPCFIKFLVETLTRQGAAQWFYAFLHSCNNNMLTFDIVLLNIDQPNCFVHVLP